ncbi:ferritin-like domain-containing protein [Mycena pura]|uniref:Ferritin-like domain-containing protein n=1 Tax=Mycena pura TaxID=153505 RepID=A0AAD6Y9K4_9AGAR|nr:ferritin-like domain-containing protein [Mycena pura]
MKFSIAAVVLLALPFAKAHPARRSVSTDPQILNFALTLEHLESAFYSQTLAKFSPAQFAAAGYPSWVRGRFEQISDHENIHVTFLSTALAAAKATAVKPCEYNFPIPNLKSAMQLAAILEAVGSTAYTGAILSISNKDYAQAAASILGVEARHAGWINSAVQHGSAWDSAFQTALGAGQVYTLASQFIKSCPEGNAAQLPPLKRFPALTIDGAKPGKTVTVSFAAPNPSNGPFYAVFITGISTPLFVLIQKGNKVEVPVDLMGIVYCVITNSGTEVNDVTTVAGPAILSFEFDSEGKMVG